MKRIVLLIIAALALAVLPFGRSMEENDSGSGLVCSWECGRDCNGGGAVEQDCADTTGCIKKDERKYDIEIMTQLSKDILEMKVSETTEATGVLLCQLIRNKAKVEGMAGAADKRKSPAEIYTDCIDSVVAVAYVYKCDKCENWHANAATGFVVGPDGVIVTNYHVIGATNASAFGVMTHDRKAYPVKEILAASQKDDIAILKIEAEGLKPAAINTVPEIGSAVSVISHPANHYYTMTTGIISRYLKTEGDISRIEITADYAYGSSGGPVFDECGNVVGIVRTTSSIYYGKDENGNKSNLQMVVKTCVPAEKILEMVEMEE